MRAKYGRVGGMILALVVMMAATAGQVFGQGFYYKEIEKEGRIYVFNSAARAEAFEKSGEVGIGITKPGAGPKGETIVGDSERALQLYFFKHGIAEPVPEPPPPVQRIEWRDGKTRITTDLAYLEISNRVQPRYTQEFPDELTPSLVGNLGPGEGRGSFRIRRAKLKLEGWFWIPPAAPANLPKLSYEVQLNWAAVSVVTGQPSNVGALLEDANIAWDPKGKGQFRVVFGQYKPPFGRQELTSSGSQQFVDRSLVSNFYARGRETGVSVQGVLWSNKLEYRAGMFNGNGLTRSANDNDGFQYNARLMWQPNGNQALGQRAWVSGALYSEADFESTTVPLYAVGLNYEHSDFHGTTANPTDAQLAGQLKWHIIGVDGIYKFKGFSATGEYFFSTREAEGQPTAGDKEFDANGGYLQAGMMLNRPRTWEAAFRYGQRDPNDSIDNNDITEWRVALNYYYRRHNLKFQTDVGSVETGRAASEGSRKDYELRMQAQFIF
jgi:phosphate-selective porin